MKKTIFIMLIMLISISCFANQKYEKKDIEKYLGKEVKLDLGVDEQGPLIIEGKIDEFGEKCNSNGCFEAIYFNIDENIIKIMISVIKDIKEN